MLVYIELCFSRDTYLLDTNNLLVIIGSLDWDLYRLMLSNESIQYRISIEDKRLKASHDALRPSQWISSVGFDYKYA